MENQIKAGAALNYVIIGINALVGLLYTPICYVCWAKMSMVYSHWLHQ